jgi:hypothetical protein
LKSSDPRTLLNARAVRRSSAALFDLAVADRLDEWRVDLSRLEPVADYVAQVVRTRYPTLELPLHARWRHFVFEGRDLWAGMAAQAAWPDAAAKARAAFDLAITSVLLDAGAGPAWRYRDAQTGIIAARSEGLALASLRWFADGGFSSAADDPLRADAEGLARLDAAALEKSFQVDAGNPLVGAGDRAALLNRVAAALRARPDLFETGGTLRPGGLFDHFTRLASAGTLPAERILETLLEAFGGIWRGRPTLDGVPLGDCWPHPALQQVAARSGDPLAGYAVLHKLSQWLSYSLVEPLQEAGIEVVALDGLTGLPEYRNGGLFIDLGVLVPKDPQALAVPQPVSGAFVVGWRALTVALLDRLAPLVGERLDLPRDAMLLARVLEGGTWAAGRQVARERRGDGGPPFQIQSDGTVL